MPSATPGASASPDSWTDETLTVANGAMFPTPAVSFLPARTNEAGRLIMVAAACPRNLKTVARNSIARKPAIRHNATPVSVTVLRTDFVMSVPPEPAVFTPTARPFASPTPVRCEYRPHQFHDSAPASPTPVVVT